MNKTELLALGLPEASLREFQQLYHRDLRKAVQRAAEKPEQEEDKLREAVAAMLPAIKDTGALRAILATTTHHYLKNYREGKEETACPTGESAPDAESV